MHYHFRSILATLCYYDALEYPLTTFEVWKFFSVENEHYLEAQYRQPLSLYDVQQILDIMVRDKYLSCNNGFYTLLQRDYLVNQRYNREIVSIYKLYVVRRMVSVLRYIPFVRMIWLTGRLAMRHAQKNSDLDVLIVLRSGSIWTGRALITCIVHIFGWRRYGVHVSNRLCLNYFITTKSLKVSLMDRFSAHEYVMARCLFASIYPGKFLIANTWITQFRPHFDTMYISSQYFIRDSLCAYYIRQCGEWFFKKNVVEKILRHIQRIKIMRNPKTYKKGSMVIVNDQELIFLPSPHSPKILKKYQSCCHAHGITI